MKQDGRHCLKTGMDLFFTKPIHPEKFVFAIAGAMAM